MNEGTPFDRIASSDTDIFRTGDDAVDSISTLSNLPPQNRQSSPVDIDPQQIELLAQALPGGIGNVQDAYPLSSLQEGMLFHHLLDGASDSYVLSLLFECRSKAAMEAVAMALQSVIDRHDALRTAIFWKGVSSPIQLVCRHIPLQVVELAHDPHLGAIEQLRALMRPGKLHIDLQAPPLVRVHIVADVSGGSWYVLLHVHHIVCDYQSLCVIADEVLAQCSRDTIELGEPLPYRRYVEHTLSAARLADDEAFFTSKLGDVVEPTAPFGLVDVHRTGLEIQESSIAADISLAQSIRSQAMHAGVSVARLFHAAWAVVLAKTCDRDDVVFGTVLSGVRPAQLPMVGMTVNTLPLRVNLRELSTHDLLARMHDELTELLDHRHCPLIKAQMCSNADSATLFTTLFNYRRSRFNFGVTDTPLGPMRILSHGEAWTNYPITLIVDDDGESLQISAQTDARISPQRILGYLRTALASLCEALQRSPHTPALALSILPETERCQLLLDFNSTYTPYPYTKTIHALFEEQADRTAHEVAVLAGKQHLTYRSLNARSNKVANYLRQLSVGPGDFVGLCVARGIDMVVGILGILKTGAAYVPLDPRYPQERLQYILQDTKPKIVLLHQRFRHQIPPSNPTVAIDDEWDRIEAHSPFCTGSDSIDLSPSNAAYIIYTSGSTGKPKGVVIEHRNAVNLLHWAQSSLSTSVFERTLSSTSTNFDLSVYEIFVPLVSGGSLRVVQDVLSIASEPNDVTLINTVPSAIDALLHSNGLSSATRVVNLAGEELKKNLVDRVFAQGKVDTVCNLYGPSETTTYSTWLSMTRDEGFLSGIGRPISNTQVYVLSGRCDVLPLGATGEIYIGGAGVARGYINAPGITAERFLSDPFCPEPGARMYKTGDLGRWRADGRLEYLGRNDHQVKIRGFRIELGEIEAQLLHHDKVDQAVVIARENASHGKSLVAYVVPTNSARTPAVDELRAHVGSSLPAHMVPDAIVILDQMPLTPNGKLDRRALPVPGLSAYAVQDYVPPKSEMEKVLARAWRDLLQVERIGRNDNFFQLGGQSLLIVKMMERLRRLGLFIEARDVFESPTLAQLAAGVVTHMPSQTLASPNMIPPECDTITPSMLPLVKLESEHIDRISEQIPGGASNIQDIYPLVPLQEGILFHHLYNEERGDTYVLPLVLSLESRSRLEALIDAIQSVIDRHDILRTAIFWDKLPRPVQVVCRRVRLPVTERQLASDLSTDEQIEEWIHPKRQRIDVRTAPLMRLTVAKDPWSDRWYALLQLHHITIDHITLETITSEIITLMEGRHRALPEAAPYRDHVAHYLAHSNADASEAFFRMKLGDIIETTAPFGLTDIHGDGSDVIESSTDLDPVLAQRLRAIGRGMGVSVASLFHAAWALVVAHTSGRNDVVFGTVLLGRMQSSSHGERILGMFINTLPIRLRLDGATAKQFTQHTQREIVDLLDHEHASLAVAQRCSGISGSAPLFTTLLNYRHSVANFSTQWSEAGGVKVEVIQERTNYPITVSVDDWGVGFSITTQTHRAASAKRVTTYVHEALGSLVDALETNPDVPAISLNVIPTKERHQIVRLFNDTSLSCPHETLVHNLFERHVLERPGATALIHARQSLTYAELNDRAIRLARYLRARGVGVDQLVGICMDRSPEMVIALLATLKAGAAYLPLDPNLPAERLKYMIADAAPFLTLSQTRLRGIAPCVASAVIFVDEIWPEMAEYKEDDHSNAASVPTPDNLAYVIYTSGSTGKPKGTAMPHRPLVNLIEWHRGNLASHHSPRVLQFSALSFDVAFQEIFTTICTGATLVLLDEWVRRDTHALLDLLERQSIERVFMPPLMLQTLVEHVLTHGPCPGKLKDIIVAGEQLRISDEMVEFFRRLPSCRLHNHYGPSETHVVTALTLDDETRPWPALPSIGTPIANCKLYILNEARCPVPIGVPGEIFIGGVSVGRGYLHRPKLTAERFVADPYATNSEVRIYRTGDTGAWREDGSIEYLGRNDDQIKVRGYRVELGEIEAQISRHPKVREVAVVAREDRPGFKRLIAYITARECAATPDELRTYLKDLLPEYMLPTAFVSLQTLPLTTTGKLDRRALPEPHLGSYVAEGYELPQGQTEELLSQIWKDLLHLDQVGRSDNFFELGGHSLLVMKMLLKVNEAFGSALRVVDVYRCPTLRQLASHVQGASISDEPVNLITEAALSSDFSRRSSLPMRAGGSILLTGGTGFVGRFLLAQLMQSTRTRVYCLVRAPSAIDARTRIRASMEKWGLWRDEFSDRLVAVTGDLRLPRLGLDERTYAHLSHEIGDIYHCGSSMNHLETYASAKAANVEAARELLKLALNGPLKLINNLSTLGVFSSKQNNILRIVNEESSIDEEIHMKSQGYVASKWVAEKIFLTASERGIPCNNFRVGLVWADSAEGRFDELQSVYRVLKSSLLSGAGIKNYRYVMAPTPVDYVSRSIVHLASKHTEGRGIFHIAAPEDMNINIFERVQKVSGIPLRLMSHYDWICELKRLHQHGRSLPAVPVVEFAFGMDHNAFIDHRVNSRSVEHVHFDLSKTYSELESAGITAPQFSDELIMSCLKSMALRDPQLKSILG